LSGFLGLIPVLVPLPFILLGLIVCVVQTLVFVLLTMIYIALAVEQSHSEHEHTPGGEAHAHA
ncbi:MAG: ATP synthase F0 subunit A, partial [Deltaproteobacteria bacterium]|nr:ATP synthase F0 subunit A [Deltaproteobacteria bacterium]